MSDTRTIQEWADDFAAAMRRLREQTKERAGDDDDGERPPEPQDGRRFTL